VENNIYSSTLTSLFVYHREPFPRCCFATATFLCNIVAKEALLAVHQVLRETKVTIQEGETRHPPSSDCVHVSSVWFD